MEEGDEDAAPLPTAELEVEVEADVATKPLSSQDDDEDDPTKELANKEWDYSNRKVWVQNIHKFLTVKQAHKLALQWIQQIAQQTTFVIAVDKIKKPPKEPWMIVTLKDEAMVEPFLQFINSGKITNKKGDVVQANKVTTTQQPNQHTNNNNKRSATTADSEESSSRKRSRTDRHQVMEDARRPVTDDQVRDVNTPLWRLTESEQLAFKMKELIRNCALKIVNEVKKRFRELDRDKNRRTQRVQVYQWLEQKERTVNIQEMLPVPTPLRNKFEFNFGYRYLSHDRDESKSMDEKKAVSEYRKEPSVGWMATGWAGGVVRPHACSILSSEAAAVVDVVNAFLLDSPLPPYDNVAHSGIWKLLTVRASRRTRECMVIVTHAPPCGGPADKDKDFADAFESEKARLLTLLTAAELPVDGEPTMKVTSVFFQEYDGLSHPNPEHPVQHLYGKTSLTERVGDCTFQISPGAFFQVNTVGAEILYHKVIEKVREVSKNAKDTLLFDVCCGTGTIGLSCMKAGAVGHVVGVDISEPAIKDAVKNAEMNGFQESQVRFVAARAEEVLAQEIGKAKQTELSFVAVVDPAREGLHAEVVKTLRSNQRISRIVYVSCNPTGSLVRDAALLCSPPTKRYSGNAFRIESAVPVDMFPLTSHCELVVTFDRLTQDEVDGK